MTIHPITPEMWLAAGAAWVIVIGVWLKLRTWGE